MASYTDNVESIESNAVYQSLVPAAEIEQAIEALIARRDILRTDTVDHITDMSWIKESNTSTIALEGMDRYMRFYSTADTKFEDTSLGGNWAINPLPQFTRYADPRAKGIMLNRVDTTLGVSTINIGMGHYYSEAIDDNKQVIHMRMGVPEYNSLVSFFTGFYDTDAANLARSGSVVQNFTYTITKAAVGVLNIIFWPLLALHTIGYVGKFLAKKPSSKYYYLRPTMLNYWTGVTTMLNQILAYKRMLPTNDGMEYPANETKVNETLMSSLQVMMPHIFSDTGYVDVYKVANRAAKIRNEVNKILDQSTKGLSFNERIEWAKSKGSTAFVPDPGYPDSLQVAAARWFSSKFGRKDNREDYQAVNKSITTPQVSESGYTINPHDSNEFIKILHAEFRDGSQFATFRVDYTDSVDENFSNSSVQSTIASTFNSTSASARSAQFSVAGGNLDGGIASGIVDAVKGVVTGALDGLKLSGFMSLAGAAFVDIPEHWDNSSAKFPSMQYTIPLRSPYGNPISQMQNIVLPLCMLLTTALPLSTGPQSYTSPFLVEIYDRGKAQTRLGMVDSISITRGTTNLGFNRHKVAMGIDVSLSIKDLSSVMHMPLTSGMFGWNPIRSVGKVVQTIFGEDTPYSDYLHVLAGAHLAQSIYPTEKLRDNFAVAMRRLEAVTSMDRWAAWIHESPVGLLDIFIRGTERGR